LKKDVEILLTTESLNKVMKLRGVSFDWIEMDNMSMKTYKKDIGFIAQEVETIFPELIIYPDDGTNSFYKLKYDEIVSLCISSIKEQSNILKTAEERLEIIEMKML
jgi:glucan phosphoethanolaminetransferase (alkaline phosphatase superfamily)